MFLHNQNGCNNYYPQDAVLYNGGKTLTILQRGQMPPVSEMPTMLSPSNFVGPTGPQGPKGEPGVSPTIKIAEVVSVPYNAQAEVNDNVVGNEHQLTFKIPQGEPGAKNGAIKLMQSVQAREIEGNIYTKLLSYIILPGDAQDLTVNTNSITINAPGIYKVDIQGYVDATEAVSDVIVVQLELDGAPLETTAINVIKGSFDNFYRTVFLNLSEGDNIQILHEGTDNGGSTSDVELIFTRLEFEARGIDQD